MRVFVWPIYFMQCSLLHLIVCFTIENFCVRQHLSIFVVGSKSAIAHPCIVCLGEKRF